MKIIKKKFVTAPKQNNQVATIQPVKVNRKIGPNNTNGMKTFKSCGRNHKQREYSGYEQECFSCDKNHWEN